VGRRRTAKWMIVCIVAAVVLGWLVFNQFSGRSFDWRLAATSFERLDWNWIAMSVIPIFGTYYGRALRWRVFLKPQRPRASIGKLLSATVIGFTAVTLFGRPGEFVRPYLIARKEQLPVASQFAAWALERIFDLLMALLVAAFALTKVQSSGIQVGPTLSWVLTFGGRIIGVLGVVVLVILLSLRHFAEPVRVRLLRALHRLPERHITRVERLINGVFSGVESMRSDGALFLVFVYSVAEWVLICACYWCLAKAFTGIVNLSPVDVLILTGFVSFGSVVQIPGVGGGTQVVTVLVLTELFGIRLELASAFALLLWILTFVAIVPVGLLVALKEGLDWRSLRHLGDEVPEREVPQ
jgi:glycosyltransferase 2 family protein